MDGDYDYIIVHDPQPAALRGYNNGHPGRWIWRCHIDLSTPNMDVMERMVPMVEPYDCKVFHLQAYVPKGVDGKVEILPPAIDPLSPKNMALSPEDAAFVCDQFGVDVDRPLLCQVSRFDPWKDPLGVIDCYRQLKEQVTDLQLALVGSMATDDPEGWDFFQMTHEHAKGDEDIKILNNLNNVGAIEVNAFQSQADVVHAEVDPRGIRPDRVRGAVEGAARPWPGNVGGIPLQIQDGETGYLVNSPEEAAAACLEVLSDPELGKRLGRAGKEYVRTHFLMPRLLRDWLRIFNDLA